MRFLLRHPELQLVMPKRSESEIPAKYFVDMGEKRGENLVKNFSDFRPSISRKNRRKKFHEKFSANSTGHEIKFFHRETLGAWGTTARGRNGLKFHM